MATLVQFLAAGVKGAESGTATFVLRGSASSAASFLYNDFERTAQPGTNIITLDANGAAEVYCSVYCDVTLKNSAGTTLRTVTVGNSSSLVEVRSTSFKGDDYDGSPSNTAGQPITLTSVLNLWATSAGTTDFKVLFGGVATNLQTALAGFSGLFTNVKDPTYGAVGDGVTNDTTAIAAAITAAAGGVVFFPAGTYVVDQIVIATANINLLGFGATLALTGGGASLFSFSDNTQSSTKRITGFRFTASGSAAQFIDTEDNQNIVIDSCRFETTNITGRAIRIRDVSSTKTRIKIVNCDFILSSGTSNAIRSTAVAGLYECIVEGCSFLIPASFTGTVVQGPDFNISNCVFDGALVTSGVYRHIDAEDQNTAGVYRGTVNNCRFIDGGSTGFVFKLTLLGTTCSFSEDGNTFVGFTAPAATLEKGRTYEITDAESGSPGIIRLGSRKGRTVHLTAGAAFTITVSACLEAENVVVEHSGASGGTFTIPALLPGLTGRVVVFHTPNATDCSIAFVDSAGFGAGIKTTTIVSNEAILSVVGDDTKVCSCEYFTTVRAAGTFRSLITSEVNHWV